MSVMGELEKFTLEQEAKRQLETKNMLDKINYRQGLINEKDKIIKNLNYEKELITDDIVNLIKNLTSSEMALCWGANNRLYRDVWYYYHHINEIEDEENKKKLKNSYDLVLMQIKSRILLDNKEFKLQNISAYGYDGRGYSFIYKYKKETFEIYIPMFDVANEGTYQDMLIGYRILIQNSKSTWTSIICDLNPNVVANKLKEYIEKLEEKE